MSKSKWAKGKGIVFGLVLILLAVYLVVSRLGYAPALPVFSIVFTVLFAYTAITGFVRLRFFEGFMSLAILGCIHDELLGIEAITPWTLLLAGFLIGIAFDIIFKNVKKNKDKDSWSFVYNSDGETVEETYADGANVRVDNSFGHVSKYISSDAFSRAKIENSFGETNVYFNNVILAANTASIKVENSFGETNIYLPRTWRVEVRQETSFGSAKVHGNGSSDMESPLIYLRLECSFGEINVYFE